MSAIGGGGEGVGVVDAVGVECCIRHCLCFVFKRSSFKKATVLLAGFRWSGGIGAGELKMRESEISHVTPLHDVCVQ